jgi:hypothetical protein
MDEVNAFCDDPPLDMDEEEEKGKICAFLRTHLTIANATGPSRIILDEHTLDRYCHPWQINQVTFHIYWMRHDHVPSHPSLLP